MKWSWLLSTIRAAVPSSRRTRPRTTGLSSRTLAVGIATVRLTATGAVRYSMRKNSWGRR